MVVRRLRLRIEVDEAALQTLVHDLLEACLFPVCEEAACGQFFVDAHPRRTAPTAVVATAVDVTSQRTRVDVEDALALVAADGGEEDVEKVALALRFELGVPVEDQPAEGGGENLDFVLVLASSVDVAAAQPIPRPPAPRKRIAITPRKRLAQRRCHGVDVLDLFV